MVCIDIEEAVVSEDGQHLKCTWPGGHESSYSFHWLHDMKMPEREEFKQLNQDSLVKDELIIWNKKIMQDKIPFYDYNVIMNENKSLFDFLYRFYQNGITVIDNAPIRSGVLMELASRIGYHRATHYGYVQRFFSFLVSIFSYVYGGGYPLQTHSHRVLMRVTRKKYRTQSFIFKLPKKFIVFQKIL